MAQTVSIRYVVFNNADNPQSLIQSLTALTVDNSVIVTSPCYVYDQNGNLVNNSSVCIFALAASNDASFRQTLVSGSAGFSTPIKTWAHPGVNLG
jgi:hypothetical protein